MKLKIECYLCFIVIITILSSCKFTRNTNFLVKGKIKGEIPPIIYLVKLTQSGPQVIDSVNPKNNGKFILKNYIEQPIFFLVKTKTTRGINLLIKPGDRIKLFINSNDWDFDYIVENSPESRRIHQLIKEHNRTMLEITKLSYEFEKLKDSSNFISERKRIDSIYDIIYKRHKNFSINFIKQDPCSFASLMALYQSLGIRVTVFNIKEDFHYFNIVDSCLSKLYPESEPVKILNKQINRFIDEFKTEIGSKIPDVSLPDTSNNYYSLHRLIGNKDYSLIIFWSSWCLKCPYDMVILKNIEKNFSSNIQIIQISIEKSKIAWKSSITNDLTNWIKLADCKYWDSEIIDIYKVYEVPYYILVNKNGKIILKDNNINSILSYLQELK